MILALIAACYLLMAQGPQLQDTGLGKAEVQQHACHVMVYRCVKQCDAIIIAVIDC
jgi:hypothetical protein